MKYSKKTKRKDKLAAQTRGMNVVNDIKNHYGCLNPHCACSGSLKPCCLDFHHIDEHDKKHVSQILGSSIKRICEEINKCTLLCAVCHRLATYDNLDCGIFPRCVVAEDGSPKFPRPNK